LGTLFLQLSDDQRGAGNRIALVYFGLLFSLLGSLGKGFLPPTPSQKNSNDWMLIYFKEGVPMVLSERAVFYKEKASATYRSWVYSFTFLLADIPFALITTVAFVYVYFAYYHTHTHADSPTPQHHHHPTAFHSTSSLASNIGQTSSSSS